MDHGSARVDLLEDDEEEVLLEGVQVAQVDDGLQVETRLAGGHLAGHQLLLEHVKQLDVLPVLDGRKEGNVLFNKALNIFYLWFIWHQIYGKRPFRSKRKNLLLPLASRESDRNVVNSTSHNRCETFSFLNM